MHLLEGELGRIKTPLTDSLSFYGDIHKQTMSTTDNTEEVCLSAAVSEWPERSQQTAGQRGNPRRVAAHGGRPEQWRRGRARSSPWQQR